MSRTLHHTDCVIVGAGYAGIAAASRLHAAGKSFLLLEARNRIGGRVHTQQLADGTLVDLGAQWIGPAQHLIWEWTRKHQVATFDCYDSGKNILCYKNRIRTYKGTIPKMDPISLIDLGLGINRLNKLCRQVPLEAPWTAAKAEEWDSITLDTWINKNVKTYKARKSMHIGIETVFACQAAEISLLHALFYCHSGGNLDALLAVTGGAQQTLFVKGAQHLLELEAATFSDKIYLEQPVRSIRQHADGVTVLSDRMEISARKVILALPPALCQKIHFEQPLPYRKTQLFQRMPMGAAMKCYAIYNQPFWREQGYSGQIVSDRTPLHVSFDCTKPDGKGALLFFVEGKYARDFIEESPENRRRKVLSELAFFYGKKALEPVDYTDKCWIEEEYSGGCYAGNFTPGSWTQFGPVLRTPAGHIHWAGTETALKWCGYMDGAIESGQRAADEVLEQ